MAFLGCVPRLTAFRWRRPGGLGAERGDPCSAEIDVRNASPCDMQAKRRVSPGV